MHDAMLGYLRDGFGSEVYSRWLTARREMRAASFDLRINITYDDVERGSDVPDAYAAGITALRQQQQRVTVNPSPLFQMAAEKDRKASDDRAAFEARLKAQRLATLTAEHRVHDAAIAARPSPRLTAADLAPYRAPDAYSKALKDRS